MLLDKAQLLDLTASEMVVLIAGFRSLGISHDGHGILSQDTNKLSNEFLREDCPKKVITSLFELPKRINP